MMKKILGFLFVIAVSATAVAAEIAKPLLPGDNDTLIKLYMDTKDPRYLQSMLTTYAEADDGMLRDARRYAFLVPLAQNSNDPKNPRPTLGKTIAVALCKKYHCAPKLEDSKLFSQMITASSGMWALDSLSQQNPQIKKVVEDFLKANARVKTIYDAEAVQFSNYKVLVVAATLQPKQNVEPLLLKYETLEPLDMEEVKKTLGMKPTIQ